MQKQFSNGQISLDIIIAILFAMIFFNSLAVLSEETTKLQQETAIRMQLKQIAIEIPKAVLAAKALDEDPAGTEGNSGFLLNYEIPKITVPGNNTPEECTIAIDQTEKTVSVSVVIDSKTITESIGIEAEQDLWRLPNASQNTVPLKCGETLSLSRGLA